MSAVPVHVIGHPGNGKTSVMSDWAGHVAQNVAVVRASHRDKGDFMGLPADRDGLDHTIYLPPQWVRTLQRAGGSALLLEEVVSNSEAFGVLLGIIQEKVVGEEQLPANTAIVATSNPPDVAVDGADLPAPVANRLMHVEWVPDFDEWSRGLVVGFDTFTSPDPTGAVLSHEDAAVRRVVLSTQVVAFLRDRRDLWEPGVPKDIEQASKGWPSPRSWDNATRVLAYLDPEDDGAIRLALNGLIGPGAANAYLEWARAMDLIDPLALIEDPNLIRWVNERPDRLYAVLRSVTALALTRADDEAFMHSALRVMTVCAESGRADIAVPGARQIMARLRRVPRRDKEVFDGIVARTGAAVSLAI